MPWIAASSAIARRHSTSESCTHAPRSRREDRPPRREDRRGDAHTLEDLAQAIGQLRSPSDGVVAGAGAAAVLSAFLPRYVPASSFFGDPMIRPGERAARRQKSSGSRRSHRALRYLDLHVGPSAAFAADLGRRRGGVAARGRLRRGRLALAPPLAPSPPSASASAAASAGGAVAAGAPPAGGGASSSSPSLSGNAAKRRAAAAGSMPPSAKAASATTLSSRAAAPPAGRRPRAGRSATP